MKKKSPCRRQSALNTINLQPFTVLLLALAALATFIPPARTSTIVDVNTGSNALQLDGKLPNEVYSDEHTPGSNATSALVTEQTLPVQGSTYDVPTPKDWSCNCWNSTNEFEDELECRCSGSALLRIPQKLPRSLLRLTITSAGLTLVRTVGLKVYALSIRDIVLSDLEQFESIQPGAFENLQVLRTIYISHAPKLEYLSKDVFRGISSTIKTIRICNSGLVRIPDMRYLPTNSILQMVDLEGNRISSIESRSVRIKTEQLVLDNNILTQIDDSAFSGSQIAKLSLKGNTLLQSIHQSAFTGIMNIQELDLSRTSLIALPTDGLQDLEVLRVQNTHTLKTIPSIYNFKNLQVAWLTHPFHCCAFKFPSRHDPIKHAERLKEMEKRQRACEINKQAAKRDYDDDNEIPVSGSAAASQRSSQLRDANAGVKRHRRWTHKVYFQNFHNHFESDDPISIDANNTENQEDDQLHKMFPIRGLPIVVTKDVNEQEVDEAEIADEFIDDEFGEFHDTTADVAENNQLDAFCGNWTVKKIDVSCFPIPDALNPCEDVMGSYWLRASVWVVVLLAVVGNVAVLVVILFARSDTHSVSKFLMCHLAFADLCTGLYLLLIASIDAYSMGEYFNYAFDWQYGAGCKVAGFLTVFASHLSVFTLTIITLERWFAITHAIYLNKRIKIKPAAYIMLGGWMYSFLMSSFPLFGISNYSSTSICLPMETRDSWDVVYLVCVLALNGAAFFAIAICYAQIYFSLGKETRRARNTSTGEMSVAKKMSLLVFTNFSCYAPIAFFALTALAGYPLINVTKSKILLVFFYPLNSCADPYLYAILTTQYRKDLFILLSRFGFCKKQAMKYRGSVSMPATNVTYPINSQRTGTPSPRPSMKKSPETQLMLEHEDFV